jgi:GT2 family glycosyltransferase
VTVPDIVTFGIPLMARSVAQDWDRVEHQLGATLGSIYNQTDPNFRIIIACTDRPSLAVPTDERLEFLLCEQVPAVDHTVYISDAARKRSRVAQRLRQLGGGYLMLADADDLISSRLVAYVRETAHPNGYSVARGYMLDAARGWLAPFPFAEHERFDWESHTSAVLRLTAEELPAGDGDMANRYWNLVSWGHPATRPRAEKEGRPLLDIPFRAAVYVRNTGENVSTREAATTVRGRVAFQAHLDDQLEAQRIERTPELDAEFNLEAAVASRFAARPTRQFRPLVGLSVLIATHRRPEGLRRLLSALRPQVESRPERSIVVVNDGSHDDAYAAVVEEFRDIILYQALPTPEGIVVARNTGIRLCQGAYAVFIDDDCEPPPWWLDWLAARLRAHPEIDVVAGITRPLWQRKDTRERIGELFVPGPSQVGRWLVFVTANAAVRTELLRSVGGFGFPGFAGAGEDTELGIRLHRAGARFLLDKEWWVRHAVGDSLRTALRRYRRYGEANAHIGELASVTMHIPGVLERRQLGKLSSILPLFSDNLRKMQAFEGGRFARLRAAATATAMDWTYLRGLASPRRGRIDPA